jgi:hypothetical protein
MTMYWPAMPGTVDLVMPLCGPNHAWPGCAAPASRGLACSRTGQEEVTLMTKMTVRKPGAIRLTASCSYEIVVA